MRYDDDMKGIEEEVRCDERKRRWEIKYSQTVFLLRIAFDTLGPREARVLSFLAAILSLAVRFVGAAMGGAALAALSRTLSRHWRAVFQPNVFLTLVTGEVSMPKREGSTRTIVTVVREMMMNSRVTRMTQLI